MKNQETEYTVLANRSEYLTKKPLALRIILDKRNPLNMAPLSGVCSTTAWCTTLSYQEVSRRAWTSSIHPAINRHARA